MVTITISCDLDLTSWLKVRLRLLQTCQVARISFSKLHTIDWLSIFNNDVTTITVGLSDKFLIQKRF